MGAARGAVLAAVLGATAAGACAGASAYACTSDGQCIDGGAMGQCESTGYCSFGDDSCGSGRRYGDLAPPDLAGECTIPVDETGTEASTTDPTTTIDPSSDESTSNATTQGPSSATTPIDPTEGSASSDPDPTTSGSEGDTELTGSSTTAPPMPTCAVTVSDDFEDAVVDPGYGTWSSTGCWFDESGGSMNFSIGPSTEEWISAGFTVPAAPFVGGYVRAELVPFSPPLDVIGVWLTIFEDTCELQIAAEGGLVVGKAGDVWLDDGTAVATDEPLWLQLRVDLDGIAYWEWSTDGMEWNLFHSELSPCNLDNVSSALFAGGVHDQVGSIVRSVASYERCDPF